MDYYDKQILSCFQCNDLIRVGRNKDGGYLVPKRVIKNSNYLISGGIYTDWSFEQHFNSICDVKNYFLIDKTSNLKGILNTTLRAIKDKKINFLTKFLFLAHGLYHSPRTFFWRRIVKNHFIDAFLISSKNKDLLREDMTSLPDVINKLNNKIKEGSIFLKLDIEGSEWEMIEDMANSASLLSGVAIEVHELEVNGQNLEKLIKKFEEVGLYLVHVHPNNYGGYCSKSKLPKFLEITFMNQKYFTNKELSLPKLDPFFYREGIDQPCNPRVPELT